MFQLSQSDLDTIKALTPFITGIVTGITGLLTLLGIKRRIGAFFTARAERREWKRFRAAADRREKESVQREIAIWYARVYGHLINNSHWDEARIHNLSVTQVCAVTCKPLPGWAQGGWERVRLHDLATPISAAGLPTPVLDPQACEGYGCPAPSEDPVDLPPLMPPPNGDGKTLRSSRLVEVDCAGKGSPNPRV